jgi:hypothetical protein
MMRYFSIILLSFQSVFATDSSPTPLKLSPFPNGLQYKSPTPEPTNSGNPLLSNTRRIPSNPKASRPPVRAGGGATGGGGVGSLKAPVGTF